MGPSSTVRPELAALLAAVRAEPEEDTPRLVLADWLDEQGTTLDARLAVHVRAQVAQPTRIERGKAELRELFPTLMRASTGSEGVMSRGTLRVNVSSTRFREPAFQQLAHSEDWLWVERVTLDGLTKKRLEEVISSLLFQTVRVAELGPWAGDSFENLLPRWMNLVDKHLPNLDAVALPGGAIGASGFRALRKWSRFRRLRHLALSGNHIEDDGLYGWNLGVARPALQTLDLSNCSLTPNGIAFLATMPGLESLRALDISGNALTNPASWNALSTAHFCDSLRVLRWETNAGSDFSLEPTLRALFETKTWPALEVLDVGLKRGDREGRLQSHILRPDRLPRLRALHCTLSPGSFDPNAFRALAANGLLRQLRALSVTVSPFDETLPALARLAELSRLEVLEVNDTGRCTDNWDAFVGAEVFAALHRLGIGNAATFTETHARALVESEHFPALNVVSVGWNTPERVRQVLASRFAVWG